MTTKHINSKNHYFNEYFKALNTVEKNIKLNNLIKNQGRYGGNRGKIIDNIVFLCYDAADTGKGDYCHRFILAESFEQEFYTTVLEYGYENYSRINYRLEIVNKTDILF